ncbi:MAG: dihydrofolate reductase family protein [Oscillospiraceae bacterium]|nr:dihydrofolate reductase family protein [Oscillospiraceae bacterium]
MKVTILMALSLNGFIARQNGDEDFLSNKNWQIMKEYIKEYDNLIFGRVTYENVITWGEQYQKDLENVNLVIISRKENKSNEDIIYCQSPKQAIEYLKNKGMNKVLISGGAQIITSFINEGLADELVLSYNPVIVPQGISLFREAILETKLELKDTKIINDIVHVKYNIIK